MPRPIILGVVGDSAAGKTTHHARARAAARRGAASRTSPPTTTTATTAASAPSAAITPLHPDCNYIDIMEQDLAHVRAGRADPQAGLPAQGRHVRARRCTSTPRQFTVVEGLLGYHTRGAARHLRRARLPRPARGPAAPVEGRSATARGAATRPTRCSRSSTGASPTPRRYIRPQQRWADIVVSFMPGDRGDQEHLDAELMLRDGLVHPDLERAHRRRRAAGCASTSANGERHLCDPGRHRPGRRRGDRGGDLGSDALRQPPALRAPGRVHDRHRAAPLGVAGDRPGARPLPPRDGAGDASRSAATGSRVGPRGRRA